MTMARRIRAISLSAGAAGAALAAVAILYAYHLSNPRIEIPHANRKRFANVAVVLDETNSMSAENVRSAKWLVTHSIIPNVGLSDRLLVLEVSREVSLRNIILGSTLQEQQFQFDGDRRGEILKTLDQARSPSSPGRVREQMYRLIQELRPLRSGVQQVHDQWTRKIETVGRPTDPGSNIRCALEALGVYLGVGQTADEERWLFVISDMRHEGNLRRSCASPEASLWGVHIVVLYPHDSTHDWESIINSWRSFFGDRQIDVYPFSVALNHDRLLPPNPLSGLTRYEVRGFWQNFLAVTQLRAMSAATPE
jgi:hypothetical protein